MGDKSGKAKRKHFRAEVIETRPLTPRMTRVVLGGADMRDFAGVGKYTDHYVKLILPPPGATYTEPFEQEEIKATLPRDQWPRRRAYTVRDWDPVQHRLTLDILHHGSAGVAGPWARAARPGDLIQLAKPGGGYRPHPDAAWHLLVGDEAAIPAIAVTLERLEHAVTARVLLEVEDATHEPPLPEHPNAAINWLHRRDQRDSIPLLSAVERLDFPAGAPQGFIHGEADMVRAVRRHLVRDRQVPVKYLSASGYWRRSRDDETWRAEKSEWKRLAKLDLAA